MAINEENIITAYVDIQFRYVEDMTPEELEGAIAIATIGLKRTPLRKLADYFIEQVEKIKPKS